MKRGEELAKNLKLDTEKLRLKLAAFFDRLCDLTLQQVEDQAKNGVVVHVADNQGNETITRRRGIDTKLLGEAGRGAIRFAQFAGLMDADSSTSGGDISTNVVFVQPAANAAEWDALQSPAQTIDVAASGHESGHTAAATSSDGSDSKDERLLRKQLQGNGEAA